MQVVPMLVLVLIGAPAMLAKVDIVVAIIMHLVETYNNGGSKCVIGGGFGCNVRSGGRAWW